jgi:hypothetical protein
MIFLTYQRYLAVLNRVARLNVDCLKAEVKKIFFARLTGAGLNSLF